MIKPSTFKKKLIRSTGLTLNQMFFQVVDEKPTGTYLDEALFNGILKHHEKHPDKPEKVKSVIFDDISQLRSKNYCSTITLDSLVELGILEMKEKMMGRKYPTVNKGNY